MESLYVVKVSAPGKVILHGEHSVLYGQTAVAGSLGLRTSIVIKEFISQDDPIIHVHLPCVNLDEKIPIKLIKEYLFKPESSSAISWTEPNQYSHENNIQKVEETLQKIYPEFDNLKNNQKNALRGFLYVLSGIFGDTKFLDKSLDVHIETELNVGAGTGSSASFAVCLSGGLIQLVKLKLGTQNQQFSLEDKKLISAWAFNCEKITHGAPSGIDNSTCTFGSMVAFRKGEPPKLLDFSLSLRILIVDTRVNRETRSLVNKVASLRQRNGKAVDCVMDACGHVTNKAIEILENLSKGDTEDIEAKYQNLAELWEMNHCLLASLGVSHPALEDIKSSAYRHKFACKLTGAGGGGNAIILIPPTTDESQIGALTKELEEKGYRVNCTVLGGKGVTLD